MATSGYDLGHEPYELERLNVQGRALAAPTRALLEAAGIRGGMRVLDLGFGAGDMSFVVADLVGGAGEVVGIERAPEAIAEATVRAGRQGRANVRFVRGDIHERFEEGVFDAVVCRFVLMYVPNPSAVLRTQAAAVRRGGIVAPIEFDVCAARMIPATPLATQALGRAKEASERAGMDIALGPRLWHAVEQAELTPSGMLSVQPHFGPGDPNGHALLAGIVRTLLPTIEQSGIATAAEVDVGMLRHRLREEMEAARAVFAFPALTCAWAIV
jgi:SAM-dependent methyltransferase